jgi:SagB-type dehydrogenase family enzyme
MSMALKKLPGFATTAKSLLGKSGLPPALAAMRPRFLHETVLVPVKDEVVIHGTRHLQILRGKSTRRLLPELIALLDGTRTIEHLETSLPGVPAEHVRAAISLLYSSGLIEDGVADQTYDPNLNRETLAFFRRYVGATGQNRNGQEAYEKLQTAEVLICNETNTDAGATLKSLLQRTGAGRVVLLDRETLKSWDPDLNLRAVQTLIVSLCVGTEDQQWHEELDDWCAKHNLTWLRALVDEKADMVELGPLFSESEGFCYRCFQNIHGRSSPAAGQTEGSASASLDFWIGVVAVEIIYLLTRIGPLATGRDFQRYRMSSWEVQRLRCARTPGCPRCLPTPGTSGGLSAAFLFEEYAGMQSLNFSGAKPDPAANQLSMSLTFEAKRLTNCKAYALKQEMPKLDYGALDSLLSARSTSDHSLTIDKLAAVLLMTAGIRDSENNTRQIKRWAATAGNLGSVEIYVAVRNIEGLEPGLYFYQSREHTLARFERRNQGLPIKEFISRVLGEPGSELPDAVLIFTGAHHRLARKYGIFGYRLLNLDAGAALSQMHLVARNLDIYTETVCRWADDLIEEQLHLEPWQEQCTAVAALSHSPLLLNRLDAPIPDDGETSSVTTPEGFRDAPSQAVAQMLFRESRTKESEIFRRPRVVPAELLNTIKTERTVLALPSPLIGGRLVSDILARRHSTRHYGPEPVSFDQLGTMLHCTFQQDMTDWPEEHTASLPLTFIVLAWRVEGLEPGVYEYSFPGHGLIRIAPAPSPEQAVELFPQSEFCVAPLVIWIFGNLAGSNERHGAFGHRELLLRAGAAAHRLWMAALGMGLAGCLAAGVVPGTARRQFGFDGFRQASLLSFVTGYGAQAPK